MTTVTTPHPLSQLTPIDLDELTERAALQIRMDRKYLLPAGAVPALLAGVDRDTRVLEIDGARTFGYESVYFDTPELTSYLLAARRRRRRFKIRIRTYLDSSLCWLEVKIRGARGSTVKHRVPHDLGCRAVIAGGRGFVDDILADEAIPGCGDMEFAPALVTRYRRSTLYLPRTASRVTVDTDLRWLLAGHPELRLPDLAVVETKTGSTASCVDRLLWAGGRRPVRISKYATGLAALRPDLPATPWRRILRSHFPQATVTGHPASDGW